MRPPIPPPVSVIGCKICASPAPWLGARDLSKWCSHEWQKTPTVGVSVDYHRCPNCSLVFSNSFDSFTNEDWRQYIYNDEYLAIDPDYTGKRGQEMAGFIATTFPAASSISVIDYGCGLGTFGNALRQKNWPAVVNYDPFVPEFSQRPESKGDLIFACEVLEHSNKPLETFDEIASLRGPTGVILATTLLAPPAAGPEILDWWYVAPRNGHVTIHSAKSLALLAARAGLKTGSAGGNLHFFWSERPAWAAHVLPA